MNKKFLIAGVFVLILISLSLFLLFSRNRTVNKVFNFGKIDNQQITIDTKNIRVPEPGEKPPQEGTAVPKVSQELKTGNARIRGFDIIAEKDSLSATKIIVYQNDIIRINFAAGDKKYRLSFPAFGVSNIAQKGEFKLLEFQAAKPGIFEFFLDNGDSARTITKGALMIVPRT